MDEVITDLILAGYVPLRSQGIALPCYASGPQSNAWYCAVCSIDGDHSGTVTSFEPFEAGDIIRLPATSQRAVSVGESWHDVLLWNGEAYVGTPEIIVEQLGDKSAQLAADSPLTLLDLAMASDTLDRAALAQNAHAHLSARWGTDNADRWQADGFVRQRLLIEARRLLAHAAAEDKAAIIRELDIVRKGTTMHVVVPPRLHDLLGQEGLVAVFEQKIAAFAVDTGTALELPISLEAPADHTSADKNGVEGHDNEHIDSPKHLATNGRVLIVTLGPRARQLMRYLSTPDWKPDWNHEQKYPQLTGGAIDIVDEHLTLDQSEHYSVIIWVTDEGSAAFMNQNFQSELMHRVNSGDLLCILAPTLPAQAPPALLADRSLPSDLPFTTILDTSIVRSPFWSGNPKRSIDRRVADLISATAQLVVQGTPLHAGLTADRPRQEPLLLSISTGQRSDRREETLASEVSSAGLSNEGSRERDEKRFSWIEIPGGKERKRVLQGEAVVRRHDPDFRPFAEAVSFHRRYPSNFSRDLRFTGKLPASISDCLRFPHLTCALRAEGERNETICVVSAEAPNLKALRAASKTGWTIARYSDYKALTSLSSNHHRRQLSLPSDIALPPLNRLGRNRGLAVRGIDPRDVIRIRRDLFDDWLKRYARSKLAHTVRWYRSAINTYQKPPEVSEYAAIPVAEFLHAEEDGDPAAKYLRDQHAIETPSVGALAKRTADLRASWANPTGGAWRLMFEDGKLPVKFGRLDDGEVAAQNFFTIDGDGSLPLLFTSRLFNIWARATLTRSPSWSSRFSITRTFETFPIPDDFLVISDGESGRTSLRANPESEPLARLLKDLDPTSLLSSGDFSRWERSGEDHRVFNDHNTEREAVLLELIGLRPDALDLDILERLVEMNRTAGT